MRKAETLLWVAFSVLTALDVAAWRGLWWLQQPAPGTVEKAVFEYAADGKTVEVNAAPWAYPMVPQPRWLQDDTLLLPPGFPILFTLPAASSLEVHVYETATPLMLLVRSPGAPWQVLLSTDGTPSRRALGTSPPGIGELDGRCFPTGDPPLWRIQQGSALVVTAGRCTWTVDAPATQVVVDSPGSSARVVVSPSLRSQVTIRWWMVLLVALAAALHRLAWRTPGGMLADASVTLVLLLASTVTPLFAPLACLKGACGAATLAWVLWRRARKALVAGVVCLVVGALAVDPVWLAERYTVMLEHAVGNPEAPPYALGRVASRVSSETTHLALGYSTVNGAALQRGAYAGGALDGVLQAECGTPGVRVSRHSLDGANACFMVAEWDRISTALPSLRQRVFLGGFNDDFTPPPTALRAAWMAVMGWAPSTEMEPRPMAAWQAASAANLERRESLLACTAALATSIPSAPLLHVYDLTTVDLGAPRAFGREEWVALRRQAVESAGGTFVDLRQLLPLQSPVYFNDYVHPSEVGYHVLARALCPLLR